MLKRVLLVLIVLTGTYSLSFGFVFTNFNSLNGLSNDNSFQMVQDLEGFVWVATSYGLNRVGPNGIKKYYKRDGLTNNAILSLDLDSDGKLWIGTGDGLCSFSNGTIKLEYSGEMIYRPVDLIVKKDYIYWLSQSGGFFSINRDNNEIRNIVDANLDKNIADGAVRSIFESADGTILMAAYNGFYRLANNNLQRIIVPGLIDTTFFKVREDGDKNIWLSSFDRIYKIKNGQIDKVMEVCKSCNFRINQLFVDQYQKVWYAGMQDKPGSFLQYNDMSYDMNEILNNKFVINDYIADSNGDMWISTFGGGIFFVKNKPYQYYNSNSGLATSYTTDILALNQKLYIGTNTSFHYIEQGHGIANQFKIGDKTSTEFIRNISEFGKDFVVSAAVQSLPSYGIFKRKIGNGTDSVYFFNSRYVFGDYENRLAIVDHYDDFLTIYKNVSGIFIFYKKVNKSALLGKNCHVNQIKKINGDYYICTGRGMFKCSDDFTQTKVLIRNQSISDIIVYNNLILIAGEFGVFMYDERKGEALHFKDFNNQFFLAVRFCVDAFNRLWVSTESGVFLFDSHQIIHLGPSDGLPSIHITNFHYQKEGNMMWLSSYDGIVLIYLDQLFSSVYKTPKFIIEEMVSGNNVYPSFSTFPAELDNRNIQFKTAFFNYQMPNHVYLRYKIDNSKWSYTDGSTLNITNLKSGNHSVTFQASEYGYVWSDSLHYNFYVRPYWYERVWVRIAFVLICLGFIFVLVYLVVRANNRKANKRIDFERKVIDLKLQALNAAINSHFVFNVLNAIQYFVGSNQQLKASKFIADFARFMRIIIDNSNLTIIPVAEEVRRIHLYIGLEIMRFEDRLEYSIEIDPTINQEDVMIPNMIIQPFVENSILHGILATKNKGFISIRILDEEEWIHIIIKDNGVGIDKARQRKKIFNKKSIGLKNVLQRLELFCGKRGYDYSIEDLSSSGETGTLVNIRFPKLTLAEIDTES